MIDVILKRFDTPDEIRTFELGRFELVTLGGMTIGRATYQPGWRWSTHVGATIGATHCHVEHVGLVISGHATAAMEDGTAGWWALSPTRRSTSWERRRMPRSREIESSTGRRGPPPNAQQEAFDFPATAPKRFKAANLVPKQSGALPPRMWSSLDVSDPRRCHPADCAWGTVAGRSRQLAT